MGRKMEIQKDREEGRGRENDIESKKKGKFVKLTAAKRGK